MLASQKPDDQDPHCFQNKINPGLVRNGLKREFKIITAMLFSFMAIISF